MPGSISEPVIPSSCSFSRADRYAPMSLSGTLVQALQQHGDAGHRICYIDQADRMRTRSCRLMQDHALGILGHFQRHGISHKDKLLLFLDNNEQFIDAFWACLLGGIIPVPVAVGNSDEHRFRLFRIMDRLGEARIYTRTGALQRLRVFAQDRGLGKRYTQLEGSALLSDHIEDISRPGVQHDSRPGDIAFIQFSSGSTSEPKGIILTHENLMANIDAIVRAARFSPADSTLSWMPLTHDMGLIGFHLAPLLYGMDQVIMRTELFIRRPAIWLEKASELGSTLLCSPNFGFKHYLRGIRGRSPAGLDLSRVRLIFNGAEPISADLCHRFLDQLGECRLPPESMFPVYGLAEATLAVSFPRNGDELVSIAVDRHHLGIGESIIPVTPASSDAMNLVCVGRPVSSCMVRITDDGDRELDPDRVGHIQIRGTGVSRGYLCDEDASRRVFTEDGWLRSGDLGLVHEGNLYITGRSKEIIFVHGQNYYPHDIEGVVCDATGIGHGKVAVAGVRRPGADNDEIVVFIQHRQDPDAFQPIVARVVEGVSRFTGLEVNEVVPVSRIARTTSGKVQRHVLVDNFLSGDYDAPLARLRRLSEQPLPAGGRSEIEKQLSRICSGAVPDREIGVNDSLFELGTSSLALIQIHEGIDAAFPGQVEIHELFDYPTIASLARHLARMSERGAV